MSETDERRFTNPASIHNPLPGRYNLHSGLATMLAWKFLLLFSLDHWFSVQFTILVLPLSIRRVEVNFITESSDGIRPKQKRSIHYLRLGNGLEKWLHHIVSRWCDRL